MRVQLHLKCIGEEEWGGLVAEESHSGRGNKENKYEEINMREMEWVRRQRERATGVKRVETRFQY